MLDSSKFDLKKNHGLNAILLALSAAIILFNHFASQGLSPIKLEEFAPLAPMFGQWWTSIQAGNAPSAKWVTPAQLICIFEMAAERGVDPKLLAEGAFQKELAALTAREASSLIADHLKPLIANNTKKAG